MLNINAKKLNLILLNIAIIFVIIFSNFCVYAEEDQVESENSNNDEIESEISEYDEDIYSIEAIVYNKVPFFDINVFSDTSAGVKMPDNSIESILKKTIAVWYVSLRNITFIILAILIIYTGMMMAISTVAAEKATYKKRLIGWLKGIVIVFFLHYIIYIIINLNQNVVSTIANTSGKETQIYNTIKTRAMDKRLSIGFPATILYLTLIVMWVRFLWTYTKRKFNVEFLIVLAPLVVAKYTYELSSGKKSKILSNWLQRFTTAVFIQSIHALFYTIFVSTVLEISMNNLVGFVIALMFLNFMLSADKLFTNIFKFNFSGKDIDDLNRPFRPKESFTDLYVTYSSIKRIAPSIGKAAGTVGYTTGAEISKIYNNQMDKLDQKNGKDNRAIIRNKINAPKDAIDDWILSGIKTKDGEHENSAKKAIRQKIILRKMTRKGGSTKLFAKRTIRLQHKETKRKFTSNYKFIKDITLGGAELVLAIPIAVNYGPETGLTTGLNALSNLADAKELGSYKNKKSDKEKQEKLDELVKSVEIVDEETGKISEKVNKLTDDEKKEVKNMIIKYSKLGINRYKIESTIKKQQKYNPNTAYSVKDIDEIVKSIEDELAGNMPEKDKNSIKNNAIKIIQDNKKKANNDKNNYGNSDNDDSNNENSYNYSNDSNNNNNHNYNNQNNNGNNNRNRNNSREENNQPKYSYNIDEIADGISSAIIQYTFGEKYKDIGQSVEKISSVNTKETTKKDSLGKVIDIKHFAETL